MRVTDDIHLGCSLILPVGTANSATKYYYSTRGCYLFPRLLELKPAL
jgi:hypothetical protein